MNKNKTFRWASLLMGATAMLSLTACGDDNGGDEPDDNTSVLKTTEVTLSRKTAYGNDWIYFSLSKGEELSTVTEDGHQTDLTWDLAFNRYNIRTNSGKSGNGRGGAYDTGLTTFDAVTEVPSGATFTTDTEAEITGSFTGDGITTVSSTLSSVLAEAIAFAGPPPSYTPNNHVYIVKTANGKYAKIQVLGFYNDEGQSGYVNFKFAYQSDGSTNLATK